MKEFIKNCWTFQEIHTKIPPQEVNGKLIHNPKICIDPHNDLWLPLSLSDCMLILQNRGVNF